MAQYRVGRLETEIQRYANDILFKQIRDPRIQGVTITGVDATGDLQQATIYYSILSDNKSDRKTTQEGLDHATGLIQSELGSRLRHVYHTPKIHFEIDKSIEYGSKIDKIIAKLKKEHR
ncbi:MAG: 30S ribosome-binding factor RbfA [Acetilactobacillus jinshanensis]